MLLGEGKVVLGRRWYRWIGCCWVSIGSLYSNLPLSVTVWPQFATRILTRGSDSKSPLPVGDRGPSLYNVTLDHMNFPAKWHLISSNGFSRVRECDGRTYRHATVTSVVIGGITECFQRCRVIKSGTLFMAHRIVTVVTVVVVVDNKK